MSGPVGVGTSTFAGITMKFSSADGKTLVNLSAGEADATADDDTSKRYCAGDKPDYGTCDMTVLIKGGSISEIDTLVTARTEATLTNTLPWDGAAGTAQATVSGNAFISTHSLVMSENGVIKGPISFRWVTKPTFTDET